MSQIWLKCVIFDPDSGKVIERWEDHSLPEMLHIKHLRSYLEQRFGEPLETNVGDTKGITFLAPRSSAVKGTVLLVIPLKLDPDSGEIFSIFKRLAQLIPLFEGLGSQSGHDMPPLDLNEPWVGPMHGSTYLRQAANDAAARAMCAWVTAIGLSVEIEGILAEQTKALPAPGLAGLRERIDHAAKRTAAAADPAWDLCEKVRKYAAAIGATGTANDKAVQRMHEAEGRLLETHKKALELMEETEYSTRCLAQLGFGISALLSGGARIERLDRACVALLHPPDGHGTAVPLVVDRVTLSATTKDELLVEIAGILCRLLIDRGAKVIFEMPGKGGGRLEFAIGKDNALTAFFKAASTTPKLMGKLGKTDKAEKAKRQSVLVYKWSSPVRVYIPAKLAVDRLFDTFGLERPNKLVVTVKPALLVSSVPCSQAPQGSQRWVM
jgi:hypothetical protein